MALGFALGVIYAEIISAVTGLWWLPFLLEAFMMAPFLLITIFLEKDARLMNLKLIENDSSENSNTPTSYSLMNQIKQVIKVPVFDIICLGYGAFCFTTGSIAFWGPDFIKSHYTVNPVVGVIVLGLVTVICGLAGTLLGSYYLDRAMKHEQERLEREEITESELEAIRTEKCCKMMYIAIFIGGVVGVGSLVVDNYIYFMTIIGISMIFIFT